MALIWISMAIQIELAVLRWLPPSYLGTKHQQSLLGINSMLSRALSFLTLLSICARKLLVIYSKLKYSLLSPLYGRGLDFHSCPGRTSSRAAVIAQEHVVFVERIS